MTKKLGTTVVALLALALAVPAFAGGANCSGGSHSAAWSGAWLQRSANGAITVAAVARNSPAARAGLVAGDVVSAVNGHDLSAGCDRSSCSSASACNVGSVVTYSVRRGDAQRNVKVKLERMPAEAAQRFAGRTASFDPLLATLVMPAGR